MEFKDYYQILGVDANAELKDIKSAYRKLARKYHPDVSKEQEAEARFKEVAEAYEVLKDPAKRAEYDELRRYGAGGQRFTPPPGWRPAGGGGPDADREFSDFFRTIFGSGSGAAAAGEGRSRAFGIKGQDIEMELPIFLEDTLSEESKQIAYRLPHFDENGRRADITKTLNIKIPPGVTEGERIRLKGQGAPGLGDAPNGDLYLHIRLVPHPLFDVEGHNLIITVPVAPWEAALGAKITVPTLDGKINLSIPANSQTGKRLRVPGKGLVARQGRGDLYAVLKVVMPDHSAEAVQQLWRQLADKAGFDPRQEWRKSL